MVTRLTPKAYEALRLLEDTSYKQRAKKLETIDERGFALILYWNQIEAALKITRYGYRIEEGWPDKLSFIRSTWGPLKRLKLNQCGSYEIVLGASCNSMRNIRNEIVHEGRNISAIEYDRFVNSARWAIDNLQKEIPKLEQLRNKKRHYESIAAR